MIKDLIKFATHLDSIGLTMEADYVDTLVKKLAQEEGAEDESVDTESLSQPIEAQQFVLKKINEVSYKKSGSSNKINIFKFESAKYDITGEKNMFLFDDNIISVTYKNIGSGTEQEKVSELEKMFPGITSGFVKIDDKLYPKIFRIKASANASTLEVSYDI